MNIKKRYKKEKGASRRNFIIIILLMFLVPYMVIVLNQEGIFSGFEYKFALMYAAVVDFLLFLYILKDINENWLSFQMNNRKLRIKRWLFKSSFSIPVDKTIYIDIMENKKQKFELVVIMKKGKKDKNFLPFNIGFVKDHQQYKHIYERLCIDNQIVDYQCIILSRGGTKILYLLYTLYKNAYNAEFSAKSVGYVKKFMEEYDVS